MSDGTRTHDRLDHNQELYQLSYAHRGKLNLPLPRPRLRGPQVKAGLAPNRKLPRWLTLPVSKRMMARR